MTSSYQSLSLLVAITTALLSNTVPWASRPAFASQSDTTIAQAQPQIDEVVECEIMVVGGGLSGTAAAYESLLLGHTVCLTDITDWVGGQLSSQGTGGRKKARS